MPPTRGKMQCHVCKKPNHKARDCFFNPESANFRGQQQDSNSKQQQNNNNGQGSQSRGGRSLQSGNNSLVYNQHSNDNRSPQRQNSSRNHSLQPRQPFYSTQDPLFDLLMFAAELISRQRGDEAANSLLWNVLQERGNADEFFEVDEEGDVIMEGAEDGYVFGSGWDGMVY